ncbi:MAG: putative porin, partial [Bacteroidota bacterium]
LKHTNTIQTLQNELGLKGEWKDLFYRGYYRHKSIEWKTEQAAQEDQNLHEHYLGLRTRYHLLSTEDDYAHLGGEYLFGGLYKVQLGYTASWWEVAGEHARYAPSLLSQRYHAYHRQWDNHWQPSMATQVRGSLRLEGGGIFFKPGVRLTRVDNHVYFQYVDGGTYEQSLVKGNRGFQLSRLRALARQRVSIAQPRQAPNHANILVVDTELKFPLGMGIHWDNDVAFAQVLGPDADVFRVPTFLMNTKLYYASETEKRNAALQAGIDVHLKSSYKADGYDPVTQQFYLQDAFNVYSYPVVDLFCNFRIQTFTAFAKLSHINEYVPEASYFVTPFYPGQKLALDIGVSWAFFD